MQTADINHEDFLSRNQNEQDKSLLVKFFLKPKQDQTASAEAGRPIYKEQEYIDIKIPGDRSGGACRPARQADVDRFPEHYRLFKNRVGATEEVEGTPLAEWSMMKRSQVEEMAFFHVTTVEQLASMSDTNLAQFMNGNAMKKQAQDFLKRASEGADVAHMTEELEKRDAQIAEMQDQIKELMAKQPAKRKSRAKKPTPIKDSEDGGNTAVDSQ